MRTRTRLTIPALAAIIATTQSACMSTAMPTNGLTHAHHAIDYIEFGVRDMAEAQRFYAAAFGWTFQDYGPDYAGIRHPDGREVGGLAAGKPSANGGPLVVLFSTDLEVSVRAVRDAGGEIVMKPFDFPGGRRFHFKDPTGNELAVWAEAVE